MQSGSSTCLPAVAKLDCPASLPTGTAVTLDCGTLRPCGGGPMANRSAVLGLCFDSELDRAGRFPP